MTETTRREINNYLKTLSSSYPMDEQEEKKVDLKFSNMENLCGSLNGALFIASCRQGGSLENITGFHLYEKEAEKQGCLDFPNFILEDGDIEKKNHFFIGFGVGQK